MEEKNELQKHNFHRNQNPNYRNTEIQIKFNQNTSYRNTETQITEIKITEIQKYKSQKKQLTKVQKYQLPDYIYTSGKVHP